MILFKMIMKFLRSLTSFDQNYFKMFKRVQGTFGDIDE